MTMTVIDWIDLFTRENHKDLLVDSLRYCQEHKGLNIFGWCLMPSHLHMVANTSEPFQLSDTIRDFKRHTSKKLIEQIQTQPESRREWMLNRFKFAGLIHPKNEGYKLWRDRSHAIELFTEKVTWQKINYIHRNPVKNKIVAREQDYLYSSARNYYGLSSVLDITCITPPVTTSSSSNFFQI